MKKSSTATFADVARFAVSLPNVEEGTAWGFPAFRGAGKIFMAFRTDLDSLMISTSFEQRDAMIEEDPKTYWLTDHHRKFPCILAKISRVRADAVEDLVRMGWRSVPEKTKVYKRKGAKAQRRKDAKTQRR